MPPTDHDLLQAALAGYQLRLVEIDQQIAKLRRRAGQAATPASPKKRTMTLSTRKRMAAGQRKRWKEARAKQRPAK